MRFRSLLFPALPLIILTACTWVKPEEGGENVQLRSSANIGSCDKKGITEVKTLSRVAFVNRGSGKVASELVTLAQNEAVILGGNAVVPVSKVRDGSQRFAVYHCQ